MTVMLPQSGKVWYRNCDGFIGRSKHMAKRLVLLTSGHGSIANQVSPATCIKLRSQKQALLFEFNNFTKVWDQIK